MEFQFEIDLGPIKNELEKLELINERLNDLKNSNNGDDVAAAFSEYAKGINGFLALLVSELAKKEKTEHSKKVIEAINKLDKSVKGIIIPPGTTMDLTKVETHLKDLNLGWLKEYLRKLAEAVVNKNSVSINNFHEMPKETILGYATESTLKSNNSFLSSMSGAISSLLSNFLIFLGLIDPLAAYKTQALDDYTTTDVSYVCKMKTSGPWLFVKIDETGNFPIFTYANESTNPTMTSYELAYEDRTTLTYGLLNTLTL